jgi:chromodomain-helicase-DNA-binding protein 7
MQVCSKLLNFTKNNIHYGVLFSEPVDPVRDNCPDYFKVVAQPMDLGTVLNKIYLDIYKHYSEFWHDIGLVFNNCLRFNREETSDLHLLGLTLRECAIFLYDQWYHLAEQRYQHLAAEFANLQELPDPAEPPRPA